MADAIGREKTEKIYYRVMDVRYLNAQSVFIDMRLAAIRAATDLFGDPSAEVDAVKAAFDGVGIVGDNGTPSPVDTPSVEGEQWIAAINAEPFDNSLFLVRPVIQDPNTDIIQLTTTQVFTQTGNPISVSDDGSLILFVNSDNFIRAINSDGTGEQFVSTDGVWSSIALSPDGARLAATTVMEDTSIYVFDFTNPNASKAIRLYTPTTAEGVFADVTVFADALDWNLSGQLPTWFALGSRTTSVEDSPKVTPTEFVLQQNYPNPFNPSTTITFQLPQAGDVTLVVYNVLGQLVRTLHSGPIAAGRHSVVWDGMDSRGAPAASGVYVYRLRTKGFTATNKLVLTR